MPDPSLPPETLAALKQDLLASLHCALPGRVESYDPVSRAAVVRPMIRSASGRSLPLLRDVPVFLPLPELMSVSPGDFCLVVFADAAIDGWWATGQEADPVSPRRHDLSDAFAFTGFRPAPSALSGGDAACP